MRSDAKVYVLRDSRMEIVSINPSLKNLLEQAKDTHKFSRSMPSWASALSLTKADKTVILPTKKGGEEYTITTYNLGELKIN